MLGKWLNLQYYDKVREIVLMKLADGQKEIVFSNEHNIKLHFLQIFGGNFKVEEKNMKPTKPVVQTIQKKILKSFKTRLFGFR